MQLRSLALWAAGWIAVLAFRVLLSVQSETVLGSVLNLGHVVITTVPPEPSETLEVTERRPDLLSLQVTKAVQNARVELGSIRPLLPWKTDTRVAAIEAPGQTLEVPEGGSHLLGLQIPEAVQGVNVERRTVSSDYLSASRRQRGENIRAFPESRLKLAASFEFESCFLRTSALIGSRSRSVCLSREKPVFRGRGGRGRVCILDGFGAVALDFLLEFYHFVVEVLAVPQDAGVLRRHNVIQKACALSVYDVIAERRETAVCNENRQAARKSLSRFYSILIKKKTEKSNRRRRRRSERNCFLTPSEPGEE